MVTMTTPSGAVFPLTRDEVDRLVLAPVDGTYTFTNHALHRVVTVTPRSLLHEERVVFLFGEETQ